MSILIKGMEMPTEPMVLILFPDGNISTEEYEIGANAKAIELPKHGDLIDRDALNNAFTGMRFNADGLLLHYGDREDWYLKGSEVETLITNATTIIESEEKDG